MDRRNNYNNNYQGGYNQSSNQGYGQHNPEGGYQGYKNNGGGQKGGYNNGGGQQWNGGYNDHHDQRKENYGGYGNKGGYQQDFGNKPRNNYENKVANKTSGAVKAGKVSLVTNQFQMKLSGDLNVYIYDVAITPEIINDAFLIHSIFKMCKKKLEMMLGIYVISGRNIFTTCDINESFQMKVEYKGCEYQIIIDAASKHFFNGKKLSALKMEDHSVAHTLINIIIKEAFRQTNLRQIGKVPRFFDISKAIDIQGTDL